MMTAPDHLLYGKQHREWLTERIARVVVVILGPETVIRMNVKIPEIQTSLYTTE